MIMLSNTGINPTEKELTVSIYHQVFYHLME